MMWIYRVVKKLNKKIQDLLERLEFNAVLYMQTGENRFLDVARESKHEIVEENKRLREALEFYGDPKRYCAWNDGGATDLELDEGLTARKALAGDSK